MTLSDTMLNDAFLDRESFLRRIPKVELHCHVVGTLHPATLAALSKKHALTLPRPEHALYRYSGFHDFIELFRLAARVLVHAEDFERAAYEYITDTHRGANLKHIELFFDPSYHYPHGVTYRTQLDGLIAGLRAAEHDCGVSALLIPSIDREFGAQVANQVIDDVLADRRDEVVGIGLDGPEDKGPPAQFAQAFARAGAAGLMRTAHVCEDYAPTPAANYAVCRDLLGCDRLDHGYRLLTDPDVLARAKRDNVALTCCPKPSTRERDHTRLDSIREMAAAGLNVTLATDDPRMFETDLADAYLRYFDAEHFAPEAVKKIALAGVDSCWLDAAQKKSMRDEFTREIDGLIAVLN